MHIDIDPAAQGIRIQIDTTLDAAGLDSLIRQLAMARASLEPAVPMNPADTGGSNFNGLLEDASGMGADAPNAHGQIVLRLRSSGLGWLSWRMGAEHILGLQGFLNAHFPPGGLGTQGVEKANH